MPRRKKGESANGGDEDKKQQMLNLLDEGFFNPILTASEEDYSDEENEDLRQVKELAAREREKYRNLPNAEEIKNQFHSDLSLQSGEAEEMNNKLDSLNLPKLTDVEQEFDDLAEQLGI